MKELLPTLTTPSPSGARVQEFGGEAANLLEQLFRSNLVLGEDFEALPPGQREALRSLRTQEELLNQLVEFGLLTDYQAGRIDAGTTFGLILGNYRILDRLGAGGMGVVFRAEHIRMRRLVAIKVLPFGPEHDPRLLRRFLTEIRAVAQLQHPNIVGAIDAGEAVGPDTTGQTLHFFVMEYVPGQDLEEFVRSQGSLTVPKACDLIHQVAGALAEAHKHNLVHRDLKPSNIQVTPEGQAKLLDFGLARQFATGLTEPGVLLGTLDYMAPEQVQNAHAVDIRADLYGLGGVLFYCLTGRTPFVPHGNIVKELAARLHQEPPRLIEKRPDVPPELDQVIRKMMALDPEDRYPHPQAVMRALLPFLKPELRDHSLVPTLAPVESRDSASGLNGETSRPYRILLADDEDNIRNFCRYVLQGEGFLCDEASDGAAALHAVQEQAYDLLILDIQMPDMMGTEVCRRLRENPPNPNLKIIMASGSGNTDMMAQMLLSGADDFITKPFSVVQLRSRVKAALKLKDAQDRSDRLHLHLLGVNHRLEQSLSLRDGDLVQARNALVLALAKMVEHRAQEQGSHLLRMQHFVRCLAEEAARMPAFAASLDENFIELLEAVVPLHDIGKVGLPDHILSKPGKLDADERLLMQQHVLIGADTLMEVARRNESAAAFLGMAIDICRHHHERFDGTGYPDKLAGEDIPLAARLTTICDVYDALRSRRVYKPALSHATALQLMNAQIGTQFDPALMRAFQGCADKFERIFKDHPE